jgi:hypothetical protein
MEEGGWGVGGLGGGGGLAHLFNKFGVIVPSMSVFSVLREAERERERERKRVNALSEVGSGRNA